MFAFTVLFAVNVYAGSPTDEELDFNETDAEEDVLIGVFDLRDRETFIQVTLTDDDADTVHVQLFNLSQSCGENNFFDEYTGNDTHVYNIRNITTNDGNDPGFQLPDGAYGFFVVHFQDEEGIGNLRIKDANGYEYRTNLQGGSNQSDLGPQSDDNEWWFNFSQEEGVVLSDIFGVMVSELNEFTSGTKLAPITESWNAVNVNILDLNEVLFSCADSVFTCTDGTDPLIPELLEIIAEETDDDLGAIQPEQVNVEFGINEAIPNSKGAPLVCPNNTVTAGTVFFNEEENDVEDDGDDSVFVLFVGLNDGNSRGSFDSAWAGENAFDTSED